MQNNYPKTASMLQTQIVKNQYKPFKPLKIGANDNTDNQNAKQENSNAFPTPNNQDQGIAGGFSLSSTLDLPFIKQQKVKSFAIKPQNANENSAFEDYFKCSTHQSQQNQGLRCKTEDFRQSFHLKNYPETSIGISQINSFDQRNKSKSSSQFQTQHIHSINGHSSSNRTQREYLIENYASINKGSQASTIGNTGYLAHLQKNLNQESESRQHKEQTMFRQSKCLTQTSGMDEIMMKKLQAIKPSDIYSHTKKSTYQYENNNGRNLDHQITELSFQQLQKEAKNLYQVLHSNDHYKNHHSGFNKSKKNTKLSSQKMSMDNATNNGLKKGFKIKKQHYSDQVPIRSSITSDSAPLQCQLNTDPDSNIERMTLVEQIRKKFSENKYMKREDVLKLLRDIQQSENEKIRQKVFDHQEVFKGISNYPPSSNGNSCFVDGRFQTASSAGGFLNGMRKGNGKQTTNGASFGTHPLITDDLCQMFQVNRMGNNSQESGYDQLLSNMLGKQQNQDFPGTQKQRKLKQEKTKVLQQVKENHNESICSSYSPLKPKNYQRNSIEDYEMAFIPIKEGTYKVQDEKEDFSSVMKIGFKFLQRYESKQNSLPHNVAAAKRSKSHISGFTLMNGFQIEPPIFQEIVIGDKVEKPKEFEIIQREIYNANLIRSAKKIEYNNEDGVVECEFKQQQSVETQPIKQNKPFTATNGLRKEKKITKVLKNLQIEDEFESLRRKSLPLLTMDGCFQNQHSNLPEAKIKINLKPYTHLENHNVNKVIRKINYFLLALIKQKMKLNDSQYLHLFKYFGIQAPKVNGLLDLAEIKQKDFLAQANMKILQHFYAIMNKSNGDVQPVIGKSNLNYFVGKGNNFYLVRQIVKRRVWWTRAHKEEFGPYVQTDDQQHGCNFIWTQWKKPKHLDYLRTQEVSNEPRIYNRLEDNYHLSNKKALFRNLVQYYRMMNQDPFEIAIPLTFHLRGLNDGDYQQFIEAFNTHKSIPECENVWIIKPGENTNRGCGIQVSNNLSEIVQIMKSEFNQRGSQRTFIVQKYIEKPLLINHRKFDIRCYALLTSINGNLKGFFYRDCYFRTSSKEFTIQNLSKYIHLTNDAIQKYSDDYGKFENGNKLSINDFQRFLDTNHPQLNISFMRDIFPQIERLVTDTFRAVYQKIDPHRLKHTFELFGYDFMIDENFRVYLIEANTNPCLEISCPLLARIIPEVIDNSFLLSIDPLFQPGQFIDQTSEACVKKKQRSRRLDMIPQIKYTLVFDEKIDAPELEKILAGKKQLNDVKEEDLGEESEHNEDDEDGQEDEDDSDDDINQQFM